MAKSFRASGSANNTETTGLCCVATAAGSGSGKPLSVPAGVGPVPALHSAARRHPGDAIAIALLLALMVLATRNGATFWQVPHSGRLSKGATEAVAVSRDPAQARGDEVRRQQFERRRLLVAQLRTDVGNVLGEVEESRWSRPALRNAGPALDRLIAKAKASGRPDLAVYWRALAEHLECGYAAYGGDRALARVMLARAARHLGDLEHGAALEDSTLRGDVISTIGTFLGTAKALGIQGQSPLAAELSRLRHRLKVEETAARQVAPAAD
jgi:hypothetical protein